MNTRRLIVLALPVLFAPVALWAAATDAYPPHPKTATEIVAADLLARDQAVQTLAHVPAEPKG